MREVERAALTKKLPSARYCLSGGLSSSFLAVLAELKALWEAYVPSAVTRRWDPPPAAILVSSSGMSPAARLISSSTIGICDD